MPLIAGFLLMFLLLWGLRGFTRVPPALLAKFIRRFGGIAGIAIGLFLIVRGGVEAGMAVLGAGLWLLGVFNLKGPIGFRSGGKGRSERQPLASMTIISPGSISRTKWAPITSRAGDSEASTQPESPTTPAHPTPIDQHYESLRSRMRVLFTDLGIAA